MSDPEGTLSPESSDDSYILCLWFGGSGTPFRPSLAMFSFSRVSEDTLLSFLVRHFSGRFPWRVRPSLPCCLGVAKARFHGSFPAISCYICLDFFLAILAIFPFF